MRDLAGRVAVVTGAASGIGQALAAGFANEEMVVVGADLAGDPPTDVSEQTAVARLADDVFERHGAVHILCANAGVGGVLAPVWEHTLNDWRRTLDVNLWGVVNLLHAFLPRMIASGQEGHVVITASIAGLISTPSMVAYNASKHAAVTIAETLDHDLRGIGSAIGVSVLCPGPVATAIGAGIRAPIDLDGLLRLHGMPADRVAAAVVAAVQDNRFYILTHPELTRHVERRARAIVEGAPPARPAGYDSY